MHQLFYYLLIAVVINAVARVFVSSVAIVMLLIIVTVYITYVFAYMEQFNYCGSCGYCGDCYYCGCANAVDAGGFEYCGYVGNVSVL